MAALIFMAGLTILAILVFFAWKILEQKIILKRLKKFRYERLEGNVILLSILELFLTS